MVNGFLSLFISGVKYPFQAIAHICPIQISAARKPFPYPYKFVSVLRKIIPHQAFVLLPIHSNFSGRINCYCLKIQNSGGLNEKILLVVLALILVALPLTACDNNDDNKIIVNETTHSIFYAPQYLAMALGYFEEAGYEIELINGQGSDLSMTAVVTGAADIALLGPETVLYVYQQGRQDYPVVFGQLTKRDGSFLVGREFEPDFDWSNLAGKEIIMGRRGGMPAMTLQYVLNQHGYRDGENITMNYDVPFALTGPSFVSGTGDYVALFEPTASELEKEKSGFIVESIGAESGEVPYTCFVATQEYIKNNTKKLEKYLDCIYRATQYLLSHDNASIAELLLPYFEGSDKDTIASALGNYRANDSWVIYPSMTEDSFNRMQDIMQNAGELSDRIEFSKVIDNSIADKIGR